MKVKVIGAGSIGNHLANASRQLGWQVDICDIDALALERTKNLIYPSRYGHWDDGINLYEMQQVPRSGYDLICIGTPPDSHMEIANTVIEEKPKAVLIEKPLSDPNSTDAELIHLSLKDHRVKGFVGYDHVIGEAAEFTEFLISDIDFGKLQTIDVEFREHWGGIFAAHPWLDGPSDSYLGYSKRGGGALCEHSHALNLWQHFALICGAGPIQNVMCVMDNVDDGALSYDRLSVLNLKTANGTLGRCVQDVITAPARKWLRLQFEYGYIEVHIGARDNNDLISWKIGGNEINQKWILKKRPDDFIRELRHIENALSDEAYEKSPIKIEKGISTMCVINAAFLSNTEEEMRYVEYPSWLRV